MFYSTATSHRSSKYFYESLRGNMVFSPLNSVEQTKSEHSVNMPSQEFKPKETETFATNAALSDNILALCYVNNTGTAATAFSKSDESADTLSESNFSQLSEYESRDARSLNSCSNSSSADFGNYFINKHKDYIIKADGNVVFDRDGDFTKTVTMLMKVIIHLRQTYFTKHVYHMKDLLFQSPEEDVSSTDTRTTRSVRLPKKISFSPKALIFSAVAEKSYAEVRTILETEKISINSKSPSGQSLLHIAAANADLGVTQLLLQYGANVKCKDSNGWSPLHAAIRRDNWKCAILLIEAGADIGLYAQRRIQEYKDILRISRTCYKSVEIFV